MKKEYINPEMLVVMMQTMTVLAASEGVNSGNSVGDGYSSTDVTYSSGFFDNGGSEDW